MAKNPRNVTSSQARVFISYARVDRLAAEETRDALIEGGFEAFLDLDDIAPGEAWRTRLAGLISRAEKVVFLTSPESVASEICAWEVDEAERQGKSVLPVVVRDTEPAAVPGRLARLNFLFARTTEERALARAALIAALSTDFAWEREKTRINDLAEFWDKAGRPRRLLTWRDDAIRALESWRDGRPQASPVPTALQLQYVSESRKRYTRRQAWIRGGLAAVAVFTSLAALIAVHQRQEAVRQTERAEQNLEIAANANLSIVTSILGAFATAEGVTLRTRQALLQQATASI